MRQLSKKIGKASASLRTLDNEVQQNRSSSHDLGQDGSAPQGPSVYTLYPKGYRFSIHNLNG